MLILLATQGWDRPEIYEMAEMASDRTVMPFLESLKKAGMDTSSVLTKWNAITEYIEMYLNLVQDDHCAIWLKLFNSSDVKKWPNILLLVGLLFCIPVSNGHMVVKISSISLFVQK